MRIVQVHPEKEPLLIVLAQPIQHLIGYYIAGTLHFIEVRLFQAVEVEMVVIEVKTTVQAEARIQHRRGDDRTCRVSPLFQYGSQGLLLRAEAVATEIVHSV